MSELKTDNAMTSGTIYILGPERRSDGVQIEFNHQAGTVSLVDDLGGNRTEIITMTAAEALGLLDVLTHERERLQQWAREEAE